MTGHYYKGGLWIEVDYETDSRQSAETRHDRVRHDWMQHHNNRSNVRFIDCEQAVDEHEGTSTRGRARGDEH